MEFSEAVEGIEVAPSFNAINDKKSINEARVNLGLPRLKSGIISCLRCDSKFMSQDKTSNRICEACKTKEDSSDDHTEYSVGRIY